jgi:DNA-binding beta-propeller fold protein YncE
VQQGSLCIPARASGGKSAGGLGAGASAGHRTDSGGSNTGNLGGQADEAGGDESGGSRTEGGSAGAGDRGGRMNAGADAGGAPPEASGGAAGTDDASGGAAGANNASGGAGGAGDSCITGPVECAPGLLLPSSGTFTTTGSTDLIALDDTTALVGNRVTPELDIFDFCVGAAQKTWALPATPGDIAFDAASDTAYVVLEKQSALAKVTLRDDKVTLITLQSPAKSLALGEGGVVFVRLDDNDSIPYFLVSVIDGAAEVELDVVYDNFGLFLAYDGRTDRLLTTGGGGINAFAYDASKQKDALTLDETISSLVVGGNCSGMLISPDQQHLVVTCGGGNSITDSTPPYQVADFDPAEPHRTYGLFNVGAYPTGAAFSPGSKRFFSVNSQDGIVAFDVATHVRTGTFRKFVDGLAVSPSGRVLQTRSGSATVSTFGWFVLGEKGDCR